MNLTLFNTRKYYYSFGVVFYFGYACFATEKIVEN